MGACAKCGTSYSDGQRFCRSCGERLGGAAGTGALSRSGTEQSDLAVFVGKNAEKYLSRFEQFRSGNGDAFQVTWHWPAFFVPFWWLLYRKLYLWALLVFFLSLVPYAGFLMMFGFGMSANYLYYRRASEKVAEIQSSTGSDVEKAAALARAGGVNNVAVVVAPLIAIAVIGILAAIAIPQFAIYRQKAGDVKARSQALDACSIGADLFAADSGKAMVEPEELLANGLEHTEDVELLLLDGTRQGFSIGARHRHGKKTFYTNYVCDMREDTAPLPETVLP